jgi:hypothetical protein
LQWQLYIRFLFCGLAKVSFLNDESCGVGDRMLDLCPAMSETGECKGFVFVGHNLVLEKYQY